MKKTKRETKKEERNKSEKSRRNRENRRKKKNFLVETREKTKKMSHLATWHV